MDRLSGRAGSPVENLRTDDAGDELLALEERIMFDGAAAAEAADAAADSAEPTADAAAEHEDDSQALNAAVREMPQDALNEVFFVDSAVHDPARLIAAIPQGAEIVILDSASDGVEQMASALDGRSDLDAIHVLAHGDEGRLELGDSVLTGDTILGEHADALSTVGQALSESGDILIYGCDFTAGEAGVEAAGLLASATGADVASSDDPTGSAILGGDWELEQREGAI